VEPFFFNFDPKLKIWIFQGHVKTFPKKCLDFFENRLKRKLEKHWEENWLTSTQYFEVVVVKLIQTLFLNINLTKILRKKLKKRKIFENFFVVILVVLCLQNINNWFGAFLWHNNCRKCRSRDILKEKKITFFDDKVQAQFQVHRRGSWVPSKESERSIFNENISNYEVSMYWTVTRGQKMVKFLWFHRGIVALWPPFST
jgi:hypothetical protein